MAESLEQRLKALRVPVINVARPIKKNRNGINISELPFMVRRQLGDHIHKMWRQLAEDMQFSSIQIAKLGQTKQPAIELINLWGDRYRHKVHELFFLLKRRQMFDAMTILIDFVDARYHSCIPVKTNKHVEEQFRKVTSIPNQTVQHMSQRPDQTAHNKTSAPNEASHRKAGEDSNYINSEKIHALTMPIINVDFQDLYNATNGFHKDQILGKGGFGTVYRGRYKHTDIAVKILNILNPNGSKVDIEQSLTEMKYLSGYRHDNILQLFAVSLYSDKKCLVYELLKGGSLEDRLYRLRTWSPLTFYSKFKIIQGIATGLNFLHTFTKPLIHGDIKPANILLSETLIPKIGDFGLAREGPNTVNEGIQVSHIYGTKFYSAPEVRDRMLSTKLDVFSFGIVLLETFTGLYIYDNNRKNKELSKHIYDFFDNPGYNIADLVDKRMSVTPDEQKMCEYIIRIGCSCIVINSDQRPELDHVLQFFEAMDTAYQSVLV